MLKIGIDKTDKTYRHFEYDDERKYGNPQRYKVLYEETGDFSEVLCSNVISIKKSNNIHNHFLDIPVYKENKIEEHLIVNDEPLLVDVYETYSDSKPLINPEEKKKPKTTKTKSKSKSKETLVPLTGESIENKEIKLELDTTTVGLPKSYEYDVLIIDNISYIEDIKYKLNELGKDGWEVCGFQTVQRMFGGCQAVIIMKRGLN